MDRNNHEVVGQALNYILRDALAPYIARELEGQYKDLWWSEGRLGQLHERGNAAAAGPRQPPVERLGRLLQWQLEDRSQPFLEEIGAVQPGVGLDDPPNQSALVDGEVLGVLPQRPTSTLQVLGQAKRLVRHAD